MPRNQSGTYTLPSGNPVSSGTLIDATWANNTLNDLANEMTDSLSRSGEGGMLAPFRITDGLQATPSLAFTNEPSTGFYRAGTNEMWAVVGGTQITQFTATGMLGRFAAGAVTTPSVSAYGDTNTGIYFPGADELGLATGGVLRLSIDSAGAVAIPGSFSVTGNVTIDTNTLFVDASNNRVGVGTVTPAVKLDVAGGVSIGSADNLTWGGAYGATTPAISGSAGFLAFYPNGSTSGELMRLTATGLGIGTSSPGAKLSVDGSAIFNDSGADVDFRIEGDTDANLVFVDASTDRVGVGTSSPVSKFDITGAFGTSTTAATITNSTGFSASNIARIDFRLNNGFSGTERTAAIWSLNPNAGTNNGGALVFGVSANGTSTTPNEVARFDQAGNLGLGVTPSAWGAGQRYLEINNGGASIGSGGTGTGFFRVNNFFNGTNDIYKGTAPAGAYGFNNGWVWYTAPSGTAGNAITFTQAMTLGSDGNLALGTTNSNVSGQSSNVRVLTVQGPVTWGGVEVSTSTTDGADNLLGFYGFAYPTNSSGHKMPSYIGAWSEGATANKRGASLRFFTQANNTAGDAVERARITSDGSFLIATTNTAGDVGVGTKFYSNGQIFDVLNDSNGNSYHLYNVNVTNNGFRFYVNTNGGIYNYSANNVSLSDERVKTDIKPLGSMWGKFKALEIVTFKYKDQSHGDDNIGVIAQQVESVAPEFVDVDGFGKTPEDGVPLKSIYTEDLHHAAIKALQEAMSRIEALEAKVAALEAK